MRDGEPSRTAFGAAVHRAVHQDLDDGRIFTDPLAWTILGADREKLVADAQEADRFVLRTFIAVRHRFAEDGLAAAVARGVDQAVVLGAGLDTFAYRNPHQALRVFEVDFPATGDWKAERLAAAGIAVPDDVVFVGCDFEHEDFLERLVAAGLDATRPTYVLWLGVVPYLTREAVLATLGRIASIPGGEVVLDYPTRLRGLSRKARSMRRELSRRVAAAGEPFTGDFTTEEMAGLLRDAGFDEVEDIGAPEIMSRYLGLPATGRTGGGHVVRARVTR
ncbi:class I SAM-dependent methyltransferase [Nocardioides marmorisolisilvae]|uniref:S-adenosyl-L-methionine-dependent methyltransferase n=1 Tax=Nocardioides marmorisolisilvae TaxID=1542737 RepID=A0A3N0DT03_9ACTN|nr:SAM-dependent methyltransferase [Nocardioides marmorisolisilvae]RNL78775.1 SAM-dependent methyltransferase [Nocardioides marmorisolisilvae]